jgi:formate-dependent phosphoribosylglycinamide formyltransferase (GAR transformylase)
MERFATTPAALVAQYSALVTLVSPTEVPRVIDNDVDDDIVTPAEVFRRIEATN